MRNRPHWVDVLVELWPRAFRDRFGDELRERAMDDLVRARRRPGAGARVRGVVEVAWDLGMGAVKERVAPNWRPAHDGISRGEGRMRGMIDGWVRDLRYAMRALGRAPGFTLAAAGTLALALGVNAAIFAVVKGVLVDPLPMVEPDRLVAIAASAPGSDFPEEFGVSAEFFQQYAEEADQLADLAAVNQFTSTFRVGDRVERAPLSWPTWNLFRMLGVEPVLGRLPTAEDADQVILISHATWLDWFGGDPGAIGQVHFAVDGPKEIIGVLPREFDFPTAQTAVWVAGTPPENVTEVGRFGLRLVGRLAPGATIEGLHDQLDVLADRLPERFGGSAAYARLIEQHVPVVRPLAESVVGEVSLALRILLAAVSLVLVIACANVANLFAVRAESRGRAFAVRRAIGAGRLRIVRTQLAESFLVALAAGIGAVVFAAVALPAFVAAAPPLPRLASVELDPGTVAYAVALTVFTALACGIVPALRASAPALDRLRDGGRGTTRRRRWGRDALVIGQTALALVLLVGSGLLFRSFAALSETDPGYDTEDVFTFQFAPEQAHLVDGASWGAFHLEFLDRLRALPGVESAGIVDNVPLDEGLNGMRAIAEGGGVTMEDGTRVEVTLSGGDYFATMRIPVERGRGFEPGDVADPGGVVISRSAAQALFGAEDPLGRRIRVSSFESWYTVVGVVGDVLQYDFRTPPSPMVYLGLTGLAPDAWAAGSPGYVIRTARAETIESEVRALVREVAPEAPMYRAYTMDFLARRSMQELTFTMLTLAIAAGLALLLGGIGLYGVLSFVVAERSAEIGVRMALGAEAARVRRMVVAQGTRVVAVGVVIGLGVAALATRGIGALLYGVEPFDPATFAATAIAMLAIGALASWVPARRASRVDPLDAMRG